MILDLIIHKQWDPRKNRYLSDPFEVLVLILAYTYTTRKDTMFHDLSWDILWV
jgi:hypothetical protein